MNDWDAIYHSNSKPIIDLSAVFERAVKRRADAIENFITIYMQATGLGIDEIELVEEQIGWNLEAVYYCRPRKKPESHED